MESYYTPKNNPIYPFTKPYIRMLYRNLIPSDLEKKLGEYYMWRINVLDLPNVRENYVEYEAALEAAAIMIEYNPLLGDNVKYDILPEFEGYNIEYQALWNRLRESKDKLMKYRERMNRSKKEAVQGLFRDLGVDKEVGWNDVWNRIKEYNGIIYEP